MNAISVALKIVGSLRIDFSEFTMQRFVTHIEQIKGRKIFLLGVPLPPKMDGAWISDGERPFEYIIFDANLSPLQQIHTQLHEIGHFLCGHETYRATKDNLEELILAIQTQRLSADMSRLLTRASTRDTREGEAEAVAAVVQSRVIQASRGKELSSAVFNNVDQFLRDMGV